jgi:hypothetical protein
VSVSEVISHPPLLLIYQNADRLSTNISSNKTKYHCKQTLTRPPTTGAVGGIGEVGGFLIVTISSLIIHLC